MGQSLLTAGPAGFLVADFGAPAKDHGTGSWPMSAFVLAARPWRPCSRVQRRSDMLCAMSDDTDKAASVADILKHIGGLQSESSPHTGCANALADRIASRVALARRFNIRVMRLIRSPKRSLLAASLLSFQLATASRACARRIAIARLCRSRSSGTICKSCWRSCPSKCRGLLNAGAWYGRKADFTCRDKNLRRGKT
jgi:hypothetical protein